MVKYKEENIRMTIFQKIWTYMLDKISVLKRETKSFEKKPKLPNFFKSFFSSKHFEFVGLILVNENSDLLKLQNVYYYLIGYNPNPLQK